MFVLVNIIFFLYYYIHNYFFHCIIAKLREYLNFNSIEVKLLVKQDKNWQLQTHHLVIFGKKYSLYRWKA